MFKKLKKHLGTFLVAIGLTTGGVATQNIIQPHAEETAEKVLSEEGILQATKQQFVTTDNYMINNADPQYVGNPADLKQVNLCDVASTMFKAGMLKDETLYGLWQDTDAGWQAWCGQYDETAQVYTSDPQNSPYWAVYAGVLASDTAIVREYQVGINDYSGTAFDDCVYDKNTGIVYIPREHFYDEDDKMILNGIRIQLLYKVINPDTATTNTNVVVHSNGVNGDVAKQGAVESSIYDVNTKIRLANDEKALAEIKENTIESVTVNSVTVSSDAYYYDPETGLLEIFKPASTVTDVEIYLENNVGKTVSSLWGITKTRDEKLKAYAYEYSKQDGITGLPTGRYAGAWCSTPLIFNRVPREGDADSFNLYATNTRFENASLPANWGVLPLFYQCVSINDNLRCIMDWNTKGSVWQIQKKDCSYGDKTMLWRATTVPKQTVNSFTSPDLSLTVPVESNFHMFCAHLNVKGDFTIDWNYGDTIANTSKRAESYQANKDTDNLGVRLKILRVGGQSRGDGWDDVKEGYMLIGLANPTMQAQSGVGVYEVRWEVPKEEPQYAYMKDSREVTKDVPVNIEVVKKDSKTNKPLQGAVMDVFVRGVDGKNDWVKFASGTTNADGKIENVTYTKKARTEEVTAKWITNAGNASRIDATTSEAECRQWLNNELDKKEQELTKKLDDEAQKWEFKVKEAEMPAGYQKKGSDEISGGTKLSGTILNEPMGASLSKEVKIKPTKTITWEFEKRDKKTNEPLSGGEFDIYISNWGGNFHQEDPNKGKDVYTLVASKVSAQAGLIKGQQVIEAFEKTFKSDNVPYVDNWNSLRPSDKEKFKDFQHSKADAEKEANKQANEQAKAYENAFNNAPHYVKIVENVPPAGYQIVADGAFIINTATGAGELVSQNGKGILKNGGAPVCELSKVDEQGNFISGAKLTLIRKRGNVWIDTWVSANEPHKVTGLQPKETYIIREDEAPKGYVKPKNNTMEFTTTDKAEPQKVNFKNTKITFKKTDFTRHEVEGAHIVVRDETGKTVDEWISTKVEHQIQGLEEGKTYTLHETVAPGGFNVTNSITFTTDDKDHQQVMVDTITRVAKLDSTGAYLKGATMQVLDENKKVVDEWISGIQLIDLTKKTLTKDGAKYNNGRTVKEVKVEDSAFKKGEKVVSIIFTNFDAEYFEVDSAGNETAHRVRGLDFSKKYTLHEANAPAGYTVAKDIEFQPSEKEDTTIQMTDNVVTFTKKDSGGEEIEGAKLQVKDENGKVIDEWISTKIPHPIKGVVEGKRYTLHEEVAPGGFVYAHDIPILPGVDENLHYEMIDVIYGVRKVDEQGKLVIGAKLQLLDKDGKPVDEWLTAQKMVDITPENKAKMLAGEDVEVKDADGSIYTITPVREKKTEQVDKTAKVEETKNSGVIEKILSLGTNNKNDQEQEKFYNVKKVTKDGKYSYFEINQDGLEATHRIDNAFEGEDYTVVEVETPEGYITAETLPIKVEKGKDGYAEIVDRRIKFTKVDITGEEIVGAKLEVKDEEGNVVDEWISTKEPHYIKNLEWNKKYTLTETIAPQGYVQASPMPFETTDEGIKSEITLIDTIHRIIKVDPNKKPVKNAKLAVLDKEGNILDQWTTGEHVMDIEQSAFDKANKGERVVLTSAPFIQIKQEEVDKMKEALAVAVEKYNPVDDGEKRKDLAPIQYLKRVFEQLNMSGDEFKEQVKNAENIIKTKDATTAKAEVSKYLDACVANANKQLKEKAENITSVELFKNSQSSGGYSLMYTFKDGATRYVDIDKFGDEANHRVSGLINDEEYIIREIESPSGFKIAMDLSFVADETTDLKLTMVDQFVAEMQTGVTVSQILVFVGAGAVVVLIGYGIYVVIKKNKKGKNKKDTDGISF